MAKLNFPDPSASPFNADNGVIYVWVDQGGGKGYWSGSAELTSENLDAVFVEVNGDNMTGNLSLGGASNLLLDASLGKILSQSTADTDPARTLVTKDYIDNNVLSDDFLSLRANAGDQVVLSAGDTSFTGNVGIGTDDPKSKLHVATNGNVTVRYEKSNGIADNKTLLQGYTGDRFYWQALSDSGSGGGSL